ncbi:MAG: hypothetical protein H0U69_16020 [Trueperaceae bacterium]|nr:hypothetical protein [Trueperaceae bacterium]
MRYIMIVLSLTLVVAACAPAATVQPFEPMEGARSFSLLVDGAPAVRAGSTHSVDARQYGVQATIERDRVVVELTNETAGPMVVHPDRSRFVLADGATSPVATGATSWENRDEPQESVEIPSGGTTILTLIPRSNLSWNGELVIAPMFPWPLTELITLRIDLGIETVSGVETIALIVTGRPD